MTPTLRKYHRATWFFLLGFLPVLFVAAIVVMPEQKTTPLVVDDQPPALAGKLRSDDALAFYGRQFHVRLLGSGGEQRQLEIEVLQPLTCASALVYLTDFNSTKPQDGILLGSLSSQQVYRFNIGENGGPQPTVVIFDPIKNSIVQTIKL